MRFLTGVDDQQVAEVLRLLDEPTIRIVADDLTSWRHQVLLYGLVDLLGRIFPRLDVALDLNTPSAPALPPGGATVGARIADVRARSPLALSSPEEPTITIHIGVGGKDADLFVDASEWQTYLGRRPSRLARPRRDTAVGPLSAACRAGARVFETLLASIKPPVPHEDELYSSALTYRRGTDPLDDPEPAPTDGLDAVMIGAGSVGGAAAYTFAYEPTLSGRLTVIDPQHLEDSNPYRAILATAAAATSGSMKVDEVAKVLSHHDQLTVDPQPTSITEWEATQPDPVPLPLTLVAVDSRESRECIQDALPLDVINAAVGPDVVAVSGHRTGTGPCVCCLHMPEVLDATAIKNRLIANGTGIPQAQVNELRVRRTGLDADLLRTIERHRDLAPGALAHYAGSTLDQLYSAEILYGETVVTTEDGSTVAVASPFVTTLAGVLLAGEAIKRSSPALGAYALGVDRHGIRCWENPHAPEHAMVDAAIERSPECLCRSVRRLRHLAELHQLELADLTG